MTFSERDGAKSCFIGDFEGSGYGKGGYEWDKDCCAAETRNGSVKFWYFGEDVKSEGEATGEGGDGGGKGFWGKLF